MAARLAGRRLALLALSLTLLYALPMPEPVQGMQIKGGAGPHEAAAIAAAVAAVLEQERIAGAALPPRRNLSAWVLSTRHPRPTAPLRPTTTLTRHALED